MPKSNRTETEQVTAFIAQLPKDTAILVNKIRQIILQAHPEMKERIKWNHPSFYYDGAMEHFDPKEYKRDIAVFNLFKNRIMLVFPNGASLEDSFKILEGQYNDGRRLLSFATLEDLQTKEMALRNLIQNAIENIKI